MALKTGRAAAAPPFLVMDVIAAANARAASLPPGASRRAGSHPHGGRPARHRRPARRGGGRDPRPAGRRADGLHGGLRPASLRARIARHYAERYGVAIAAERVAVTVGASGAFPLAFLAAFDAGDRVAMAAPFYPPYANILTALGMEPRAAALRRRDALPADASRCSRRWTRGPTG